MSVLPGSLSVHALSEAATAAGILKHEGIFKIAKSLSFKVRKMPVEEGEVRTFYRRFSFR